MKITFLSENLGIVISTNNLNINGSGTESSNVALISATNNLKIENKRSLSVKKKAYYFFLLFLIILSLFWLVSTTGATFCSIFLY